MYEIFKQIAEDNDWIFEYSRPDYQNLNELEQNQIGFFLDPFVTDSKFTDSGNETQSFSGRFMLLVNSDVDESYQDKFTNHIEPLKKVQLQLIKDEISCSNLEIISFKTLEIINLYDQNLDGILVNYNISLIE